MAKKKQTIELSEYLEDVLTALKLQQDSFEMLGDAAWDAHQQFMKEWIDDFDEDDTPSVTQIEAAEEATREEVEGAYESSFTTMQGESLAQAAQDLADRTDAEVQFSFDRDKFTLVVALDQSFLKVWQEATEGQGYFAWDEDLTLDDIKSVSKVIDILEEWAEVYGDKRIKRRYYDQWDRWEPGGDLRYGHLVQIAEQAVKRTA